MALPRSIRADHKAIASRVPEGARVLDVGCGDGALLALLGTRRLARGSGLEVSSAEAGLALARGLSVIQGDADRDLDVFPDDGFDVAILSQALQAMRAPGRVLAELARIAPDVIVSFENSGHWRKRLGLAATGRLGGDAPGGGEAFQPLTAADMADMAARAGLCVLAMAPLNASEAGRWRSDGLARLNWGARAAVLHLRRVRSGGAAGQSR